MSEIIEREEGLFTRHGATRALCIIALVGWFVVVGIFLPLVVYSLWSASNGPTALTMPFVAWVVPASLASIAVLWLWRKCTRCGRRLFAESRYQFLTHHPRRPASQWLLEQWWVRGMVEPERDHRAAIFLGSYRNGAILSMALKGRLRCQWCGHEDGVKPDYVVTSPQ